MDIKEAVATLGVLAHETRLSVFRMLVEAGPEGLPAGSLSKRLHMRPASLTFHLQQLAHAGFVTQRRASRQIIYATDFIAIDTLMSYLSEHCCGARACPTQRPARGRLPRRRWGTEHFSPDTSPSIRHENVEIPRHVSSSRWARAHPAAPMSAIAGTEGLVLTHYFEIRSQTPDENSNAIRGRTRTTGISR